MTFGASFRMVLDVGAWDNALFINAPGQSGDARQRHYDDHLDCYDRDSYFPLLFSRQRVEEAAELRELVDNMAQEMHAFFRRGYTPRVKPFKGCRSCSLSDVCLPTLQEKTVAASSYIRQMIEGP